MSFQNFNFPNSGHTLNVCFLITAHIRMTEEVKTIVIDNGSFFCKVGFSCEKEPRSNFVSIVGYDYYIRSLSHEREYYVGTNAIEKMGILLCKHPVERGIIQDFEYMEKIFNYIFADELKVDQSKHPVLITETSLNPKATREWVTEIMFEKYNVPSFYIGNDAAFSLLSIGKQNGLVFESGYGVSCSVPIFDGNPLKDAIIRLPIGGLDMTDYMIKLFGEYTNRFNIEYKRGRLSDIRNSITYVAFNFEEEIQKAETTSECQMTLKISSADPVVFNKERFIIPELLFKPQNNGLNCEGIDKSIYESITKCKQDVQDELFSNIILSGGTSMLKGLKERIQKEITILSGNKKNIQVTTHPDKQYSAWKGASIFSSSETAKQSFITPDEYKESGSQIVNNKCK